MKINAHYRYHVQAWHESGLNQANYCRQQGINPKTFSRWVRLELARDIETPTRRHSYTNNSINAGHRHRSKHNATAFAQGVQFALSTAVSPSYCNAWLDC
jgi:transposase-like protein